MNGLALLFCLLVTQAPSVEVLTLNEARHQGTLESFSATTVVVKTETESISVPITEVLSLRSLTPVTTPSTEPLLIIRLVDGSQLMVRSLLSSANAMTVVHPQLGKLTLASTSVASVRLAPPDPKIEMDWDQLLSRTAKRDMVAVRKGDVLDHLDGVIGSLNETTLQFQLDGDDIPVKREKVFGLIFSKRDAAAKKSLARLDLVSGDRLMLKQISWTGTAWKGRLVSGLDLEIDTPSLRSIDFGASKITYLSDLEPQNVKYTPFYDYPGTYVWEYRRDKDFEGKRISLGQKSYDKGLAIHSQAQLKYRLGGDYRRFQAIIGIGDEINEGNADVTVKSNDKILFRGVARTAEPVEAGGVQRPAPQVLDLDVTGVVELEIFVGFGSEAGVNRDTGDRVYFANAKLVR